MVQSLDWSGPKAIEKVAKLLAVQEVVAGSSDTVMGLLALLSQTGRDALDRIKRRSDRPYLVLVGSIEKAKQLSDAFERDDVDQIARQFWPGPLTLIVPAKDTVPDFMKSPTGGIALRIPDHRGLQELLSRVDGLFSTSANLSGKAVPQNVDEIDPVILKEVSAVIEEKEILKMVPSTILDCTGDEIKIIREGAVSAQRLIKYLDL